MSPWRDVLECLSWKNFSKNSLFGLLCEWQGGHFLPLRSSGPVSQTTSLQGDCSIFAKKKSLTMQPAGTLHLC